jgi:hypothetical protein
LAAPRVFGAAGERGVPAGVADRLPDVLSVLAAEASQRGPGRAVLAQQLQRGRHDRHLAVVDAEAAFDPLSLPVLAGEVGDVLHLLKRGPLADLVEDEQNRRVRRVAPLRLGSGPAGTPHRLVLAVGVLHLP